MIKKRVNKVEVKTPGELLLENGSRHDQEIKELYQVNRIWFEDRFEESEIICSLPNFQKKKRATRYEQCGWNDLFDLPPENTEIELQFSRLCKRQKIFGVNRNLRPIFSQLILRRDNTIDFEVFKIICEPDWSPEEIRSNYFAVINADRKSIFERRASAAGRMICENPFREQRESLKRMWQSLSSDERPALPLSRSPKLDSPLPATTVATQTEMLEFTQQFNQFCDVWHLSGMITWDLPDPKGPHDLGAEPHLPWTFPSLAEDGYDRPARNAAAERAIQNGFDDWTSWKNYSHILRIDFWERIVASRYSSNRTRKLNKSMLDNVLAPLLRIDETRVKKLRLQRDARMEGKITSLKGYR